MGTGESERVGRKVLALAALAVVVAAVSWTLMPLSDKNVSCGSALTSAGNGTTLINGAPWPDSEVDAYVKSHQVPVVVPFNGVPLTLTPGNLADLPAPKLTGRPSYTIAVACRDAARTRIALAGGAIVLVLVGLSIGWRRLGAQHAAEPVV